MGQQAVQNLNCDVPALWLEHQNALRQYIFKRVKDQDLTNDLLQEVLLKVYNFCLSRSGIQNVRSWLYQIAHNTIIDHFRKESRIGHFPKEMEMVEEDGNKAFREALEYIEPLMNLLPEEYAVPLRMADLEGMKQAEVANKLNLSLTATKSRIQRARNLLKEKFIACSHFERDAAGGFSSFSIKASCAPLQHLAKEI